MNILVTGAKGFVGKNLAETLKTIRDGKNRTRQLEIGDIFEYDLDTDPALLEDLYMIGFRMVTLTWKQIAL